MKKRKIVKGYIIETAKGYIKALINTKELFLEYTGIKDCAILFTKSELIEVSKILENNNIKFDFMQYGEVEDSEY